MSLREKATPLARDAMKVAAGAADVVRHPEPGISILIYHRVGTGAGGQMDLPLAAFERQLDWLCSSQRLLALDEALDELATNDTVLPGVVLTFDDGTTDWVDTVLPALDRHRVPATFYVATDFVERRVDFPAEGTPISWAGLKEMSTSSLVTIGSHTHTHALLDRLAVPEIDDELDRSIELLGDRLGVQPEHFAYPKALPGSAPAAAAVKARFRSAVIAGTRANTAGADPHRLWRSPIQPADGERWFRRKAVGGMAAEDQIRQRLNRLRYRGATK